MTTAFALDRLTPDHDEEYARFLDDVSARPGGAGVLGYHTPEYRRMLLGALQPGTEDVSFLARDRRDGRIVAALPGMLKTAGGLACYNSLPFFGPNVGILMADADPSSCRAVAELLTTAAIQAAASAGAVTAVFYSGFRPAGGPVENPAFDAWPVVRIPRATLFQKLPLSGEPDWPSTRRYDVRKAIQCGVTTKAGVLDDAEFDRFWGMYGDNCRERDIPAKPKAALKELCRPENAHRVRTYLAFRHEKIVAGLMMMWSKSTASYYLPCVDPEFTSSQPQPLLIDVACRDAIQSGLQYWNWESSPNPESGVYKFKRKWGATELGYEIVVVPFVEGRALSEIGRERLAQLFPFYFVYPYDRLA